MENKLAAAANLIVAMTYREATDFAGAFGGDVDKMVEWAESVTTPAPVGAPTPDRR